MSDQSIFDISQCICWNLQTILKSIFAVQNSDEICFTFDQDDTNNFEDTSIVNIIIWLNKGSFLTISPPLSRNRFHHWIRQLNTLSWFVVCLQQPWCGMGWRAMSIKLSKLRKNTRLLFKLCDPFTEFDSFLTNSINFLISFNQFPDYLISIIGCAIRTKRVGQLLVKFCK